MLKIDESLKEFSYALRTGQQVNVTKSGHWYVEGWFMRIIRWLFDLDTPRLKNIASAVHKVFDAIEQEPLKLEQPGKKLRIVLKVAAAARKAIKDSSMYDGVSEKNLLKRKITALKYRIGEEHGGWDKKPEPDSDAFSKVSELAKGYKEKLWQFAGDDKNLHEEDLKRLKEVACYPQFVRMLEKDPVLREEYFSATIRYLNPPDVYIEYPELSKRLKASYICGSIGRFAYNVPLKISVQGAERSKTVTMPFDGMEFSVLDPKATVIFGDGHQNTVEAIFKDMYNKNYGPGDYYFTGPNGFIRWNYHKMASYNELKQEWEPVNLTQPNWWENLPEFETLTKEELKKRFDLKRDIQDGEWVVVSLAAKQNDRLRIDDCHGYCEVAIPKGDGTYGYYPFGKYATRFPQGALEFLSFVSNTVPAEIVYPDPNPSYSGIRQQAAHPRIVSEAKGRKYLEQIRTDIQKGREGNLVFQFAWENCAYTVQDWADRAFCKKGACNQTPHLFIAPLVDAGAVEPLDSLIGIFKDLPQGMQDALVGTTASLLGSARGLVIEDDNGKKVKKSVEKSPFHQGFELDGNKVYHHIHLPSQLHRQIKKGKLPGVIWSGFQRMQITSRTPT
ncbi:hypothetical protein [Estrella lausannensis]|uniref:Uncharacterized protein n=1 Tax=Estrella lausannensis TaxID=483423 RepID=A0A0H5DRV1_9BACT|nr:hypothetical protein [Estrella lausannensis]CRX39446.1 conserved hypothetical protein [Estrella lausannensis]